MGKIIQFPGQSKKVGKSIDPGPPGMEGKTDHSVLNTELEGQDRLQSGAKVGIWGKSRWGGGDVWG